MINAIRKLRLTQAALAILVMAVPASAQIEGPPRGIAPVASTGDFEVADIEVNVTGKDADDARKAGWEEAQRKGWSALWAQTHGGAKSSLSDGTLNGIVSNIIIQEEQIGPRRYVAKLGVAFDRARAGQLLGVKGISRKSAPMLVIPIMVEGGAPLVFERQTAWQQAWAVFKTAESRIDYARPNGGGGESLLLNAGQIDRRSRTWWRVILDQFGAADVVYPIVRIERSWPGGPITGRFSARYGPENRYLGSFSLTANDSKGLAAMLAQGVVKMDNLFNEAFVSGKLRAEATLLLEDTIDVEDLEELKQAETSFDENLGSQSASQRDDGLGLDPILQVESDPAFGPPKGDQTGQPTGPVSPPTETPKDQPKLPADNSKVEPSTPAKDDKDKKKDKKKDKDKGKTKEQGKEKDSGKDKSQEMTGIY